MGTPQKWIQTAVSDEEFERFKALKDRLGKGWKELILDALAAEEKREGDRNRKRQPNAAKGEEQNGI